MDAESFNVLARVAGLVLLVVLFAGVLAYALWPRNRAKFERASRIPLEEDRP